MNRRNFLLGASSVAMTAAMPAFEVPVPVDVKIGIDWGERESWSAAWVYNGFGYSTVRPLSFEQARLLIRMQDK